MTEALEFVYDEDLPEGGQTAAVFVPHTESDDGESAVLAIALPEITGVDPDGPEEGSFPSVTLDLEEAQALRDWLGDVISGYHG